MKPPLAVLCLLLASACAGSAQAPGSPGGAPATGARPASTSTLQHLAFGGRDRTYRVYRPASLAANRSTPLVMVLHGRGGTASGAETTTGFDHEADARGLVVVYPLGVGRSWNAGGCCLPASNSGIDDVGYLNAVLDRVEATNPIEPRRVYVTGLSNGGMMAYRLACEDTSRFAAIAPVAASLQVTTCTPSRPVSVIHVHGRADSTVPAQGGPGPEERVTNPPVLTTLQQFAGADGCVATPRVTTRGRVSEHDWTRCRAGTEVAYYLLDGVGHRWPDQVGDPINATTQIADFFAAHPQR